MRLGLLLALLSHMAVAQFNYVLDQSIPVSLNEGEPLTLAWAGGLNASQFNTMDLNGDAMEDLVIYDRMTSRIIPFVQENNQYRYAPEYQLLFPEAVESWMLLRDYNGDGRKDIFTGDNLGMKVFENVTTEGGLLEWRHVLFFSGFPGPKSDVVLTTGVSFKINLQLNHDDLPSISDVDGDGDLDIFNAGYSNNSQIEYHKNLSMENYGTLDSLDYERVTQSWGGVENCDCLDFSFNDEPCDHSGGKVKHSGGKGLLAIDTDNDGDKELVFSESECTELALLLNSGTNESPVVTSTLLFPVNHPADLVIYPTAYYEDVDFDDKKDIIVSPNIFAREYLQTNLSQSTWFYKNTGTSSQPIFNTAPNIDFLQENMIDVGENAAPTLFDTDGDGDLDLFIGNYADNSRGSVFFFENIGTLSTPEFKFITSDYLGLSFSNFINIRPTFADMNGDTKWDFVFTATHRFNGSTQLYYFLNDRYIGAEFTGNFIATSFFVFPYEPITLTDVDLDRKVDLLVGRQNGSLEYWRNTGSLQTPAWSIENESFLGLDSDFLRQYPACFTFDLDNDNKTDLVFGDQRGTLSIISNYREAPEGASIIDIIYNPLLEANQSVALGGRAWPTVANLFKEDRPAIIVGNALGGIHILKPTNTIAEPNSPIINVYPNPVSLEPSPIITLQTDMPAIVYTLSLLGQEVIPPRYLQTLQEYKIQLPPTRGVYLLRFIIEGKSYTRKIMVR